MCVPNKINVSMTLLFPSITMIKEGKSVRYSSNTQNVINNSLNNSTAEITRLMRVIPGDVLVQQRGHVQ